METPLITLEHATVRREGRIILDDVSFTLEEGGHTALIGPNGAGKSTLMNVLCKAVHPLARDEYSYCLLGKERWSVADVRRVIGHVNQADSLVVNTTYTVRDIVVSALHSAIGLDFHIKPSEEDRDKAMDEIRKVGLEKLADKPINSLSSGERARALLARAAVTQPPLLLLDEATSGLDFPSRAALRQTLSLYAQSGQTIMMVTHELSEIMPEVKRVVIMKDGRIFADGAKEEVLREDILSEVYGHRVYIDKRGDLYSAWC